MHRLDVGNLADRYLSGESAKEIAKSFGVTSKVITNRLVKAGVRLRTVAEVIKARGAPPGLSDAEIVALYKSGVTEQAVAHLDGRARPTIRRILLAHGVPIRGMREASAIRYAKTTPEERLRLTDAAHAAVRGITQSEEYRCQVALGRERNCTQASPTEKMLAALIRERGIDVTPRKAIGRYNVDIALTESSIAVEVFGGNWHASGRHAATYRKRLDYIIDAGWLPLIVWDTGRFPIEHRAVNYIVSLHAIRRSGEPVGSQEHVIRGDGYRDAIVERDAVNRPRVPSFKSAHDSRGDDLGAR